MRGIHGIMVRPSRFTGCSTPREGGGGQAARDSLRRFFFPGVDPIRTGTTRRLLSDVETQALLHFDRQVTVDVRESNDPDRHPPLCVGQADLLADDALRLLAYEPYMPRSVLVEYFKTLFAFHLGLYFLRTMKLLPALVRRRSADPTCAPDNCPVAPDRMLAHGCCPYRIYVLADLGNDLDSPMADLARQSVDVHYRRIPRYVQSHYRLRKLDEFATYLTRKLGRAAAPAGGTFGVDDLLRLLEPAYAGEREGFFKMRLASLIEDTSGTQSGDLDP